MHLTRRDALGLAITGSGAALLGATGCAGSLCASTEAFAEGPSLAARAAAKGLIFGTASEREYLSEDPLHAEAVARECAILVAQNQLKWGPLRPTPTTYDFHDADWLAAFAKQHNLAFRGHTLVWQISNPSWLWEALKSGNPKLILADHIGTVAGRYRGAMQSWDVVNEAIETSEGRADGLADTIWLRALGPSYIERAFHLAAEADPAALLVYNDYGLDYADQATTDKRNAVLRLLEGLRTRRVPVHVLGIQAHLRPERQFDPMITTRFLDDVAAIGLRVFITELDVRDQELPRNHARRDAAVAATYRIYLDTMLAHPAVAAVITWGLSDKYSFRNEPGEKRLFWTARPLPLDEDMRRKAAWNAIADAFDRAPPRKPLARRDGALAPVFTTVTGA